MKKKKVHILIWKNHIFIHPLRSHKGFIQEMVKGSRERWSDEGERWWNVESNFIKKKKKVHEVWWNEWHPIKQIEIKVVIAGVALSPTHQNSDDKDWGFQNHKFLVPKVTHFLWKCSGFHSHTNVPTLMLSLLSPFLPSHVFISIIIVPSFCCLDLRFSQNLIPTHLGLCQGSGLWSHSWPWFSISHLGFTFDDQILMGFA